MNRRIMSLLLAIAMLATLFSGLTLTASAQEASTPAGMAATAGAEDTPEDIDVYFVDGTDSETPFIYCYNSATAAAATSEDLAYPGDPQLETLGTEMNGHNYYKVTLNAESVDKVMFGNGAGQFSASASANHTAALSYSEDAVAAPAELGGNAFVVYSVTLSNGTMVATKESDVWPESKKVMQQATCTENGSVAYVGLRTGVLAGAEEIPALGHAWDEGVVTVEPKYLTPGEKKLTCTRCGETKTEEIARLANPFEDVHDEDFFFNPVMWALDETVTGGVDETHFAPERTVMRADAMVFFWAANKRPAFTSTDKTFKDVKKKHWAYDAVMWAVENGITGGTDAAGKYFSPQRTCTRSEILQFLYAAMGKPEYTIENPYSDVKTKHWYYDGAIWAYEKGLEKGENGKFKAKTPCTRGYVVTYLYRYMTGNELAE